MRRRKLLIGIGAAAAGGSAAFGTEAFTSTQAERNVDVAVAGDQSSFLALEPTNSANAGTYVNIESGDQTLEIILDGEGQEGGGVAQDAITKLDDLFKILNQGSQAVDIYFQDDSNAVTFRSNGSAIEGAENSVELGVGEQIVVSLTVDTLSEDVSTGSTLIDTATIFAQANDPSPGGEAPVAEFTRVVDPSQVPDGETSDGQFYNSLDEALADASPDDNIGLESGQGPFVVSGSSVQVDTAGVTIAGRNGRATVRNELTANANGATLDLSSDDVTVQTLEITTPSSITQSNTAANEVRVTDGSAGVNVDDVTVRRPNGDGGTTIDGTPAIAVVNGANAEVTNNNLRGPISFNDGSGSAIGNTIKQVETEGIFAFGSISTSDFTVERNVIDGHDQGGGDTNREIKFSSQPASLNGQSDIDEQFNSLLADNNVNTVRIAGGDGVTVDADGSAANVLSTISNGISEAGTNGFVRVISGTYEESITPIDGITIQGVNDPTIEGDGTADGITLDADDVTLKGLTSTSWNNGLDVSNAADPTGLLVENCSFDGNSFGWYASNDANNASEVSSTFDDVTVRNTTFNDNPEKGIYVEKLSNATFDGIEVARSGDKNPYFAPAGVDINLKFGDYSDITIRNSTFQDSGPRRNGMVGPNLHGALQLKARGTGGDSSYASGSSDTDAPAPATLTSVLVEDNEFIYAASTQANWETVAIRAGEGNNVDPDIKQPTPGEELTITGNRFENVDDQVRDLTQ